VVVIYNLPDRDCSAGASNGLILCEDATCALGIQNYTQNYIDPIADLFSSYPDLTIVAIIEPDAIPNLATNLNATLYPKCAQGEIAYKTCISYAVEQFYSLYNVYTYLDAAHGGWIGWGNYNAYANVTYQILSLVVTDNPLQSIQGFTTNVANYQPLGSINSTYDPCGFLPGNKAIDEVHYVYYLDQALQTFGITGMRYVIDTSRNGVPNARKSCNDWCNINNSGLGVLPTANTSSSGLSIIDAFYWVKTPGESDGTSNASSPRFDPVCNSTDAYLPAPEAGDWFPPFFVMLAEDSPFLNRGCTSKHSNDGISLSASFSCILSVMFLSIVLL